MGRNPYLVESTVRPMDISGNTVRRTNSPARRRSAAEIAERRRRRRRRVLRRRLTVLGSMVVAAILLGFLIGAIFRGIWSVVAARGADKQNITMTPVDEVGLDRLSSENLVQGIPAEKFAMHPEWTEDFLTISEYARPGDALKEVNNIFVHYTGNKGTSAKQNRSYFEQLKDTHERGASAHFIIGYEGEIIQCVPLDEIAYAVKTRNEDSISIECCYLTDDGAFTQETYDSLLALLDWLTDVYDLETKDILRHYDSSGKKCPLYYVEHEDAWKQLKRDVKAMK